MPEPLEMRPLAAPTGEDIWRNVLDFTADIEAYRAEHGPFLRELRCGEIVLTHLTLTLPRSERKPWEPQPWGVPVVKDEDVPRRHLRFVYDDDSTEDHEAISEAQAMLIESLLKPVGIKPPPLDSFSAYFSAYYRAGAFVAPVNRIPPIVWGPDA